MWGLTSVSCLRWFLNNSSAYVNPFVLLACFCDLLSCVHVFPLGAECMHGVRGRELLLLLLGYCILGGDNYCVKHGLYLLIYKTNFSC